MTGDGNSFVNKRPRRKNKGKGSPEPEPTKPDIRPEILAAVTEAMNKSLTSGTVITPQILQQTIEQVTDAITTLVDTIVDKVVIKTTQEIDEVKVQLDNVDQAHRSTNLVFHGISENKNENPANCIVETVKTKLGIEIPMNDIVQVRRLGIHPDKADKKREDSFADAVDILTSTPNNKSTSGKPITRSRPIVVSFARYDTKYEIYSLKKALRGSNILITEDLTPARRNLYERAKAAFGKTSVWTTNGIIKILVIPSSKKIIACRSEAHLIELMDKFLKKN